MKDCARLAGIAATATAFLSAPLNAQTLDTTITYQGFLKDSGAPVSAQVDLEFSLWNADSGGAQIGATIAATNFDIFDGLFTVELDFGAGALVGGDRWLEIAVANPSGVSFVTLSPRQPLTAAPFAIQTRGIAVDDVGNVGIGTDVPLAPLHVEGPARATGFSVPNPNNPSASVNLNWRDDVARIRYGGSGAGSHEGFSIEGTGDSVKLRLLDNGALGLGTSDPGSVFNSKLDVIGGHVAVSNNYGIFSFNSTNDGIGAGMDTTTGDNLELYAGGASHVTVESGGDVGIGTTNPTATLDVRGRLVLDDDDGSLIYTSASGGEQSEYLRLINSPDLSSASGLKAGGVLVANDYNYANPDKSDLIVKGNVGIGKTAPAAKLDVVASSGSDPAVKVTNNGTGPAIEATHSAYGNACAQFYVANVESAGAAVVGFTNGIGPAARFVQDSLAPIAPTVEIHSFANIPNHLGLSVVTNNGGTAAQFLCANGSGSGNGVTARVLGSGSAGVFTAEGTGTALIANQTNNGHIARFRDAGVDKVVVDSVGNLGIGTSAPLNKLEVRDDLTSSNVVNIERTQASSANSDILQLKAHASADINSQFIECERGTDVKFRVWGDGDVTADGTYTGPADFAEMIRVAGGGVDRTEAGDVMVIDPSEERSVCVSSSPRSTLVAGIYSTKPGYLGSENNWDEVALRLVGIDPDQPEELIAAKPVDLGRMIGQIPLAVVGIVPCKVSAENGAINSGDLLVTSSTPGHAMRDTEAKTGTVVGKALGSLESGTGVIRVLVTLQ